MSNYDANTALIVADLQNDFADPAGSLYVREGERIIPFVNREIDRARAAGALVVYTQDWHPKTTPHFAKNGGLWPVHCVAETRGAAFHPALHIAGTACIRKGRGGEDGYSGFSVRNPVSGEIVATELEAILRERKMTRLVVVGLATDYCVKETVLDALRLGFPTTVLRAGIRAVELAAGDGERACTAMERAGAVLE